MSKRILAAVVAGMTLVTATYAIRAFTSGEPAAIASESEKPDLPDSASASIKEVDRLIRLFEERIATRTDALDYRTLGRRYLERGQLTADPASFSRATEVLTRALELAPGQIDATIDLAVSQLGVHDFENGLATATAAVEADDANLRGQLVLGDALLASGSYAGAADAYDLVSEAVGDNPSVLVRRAELAWQTGHSDDALALSGLAAELAVSKGLDGRTQAFYLTHHGRYLTNNGLYAEAITELSAAEDNDPNWALPHAEMGRALAASGDITAAIDEYRLATTLFPDIEWLSMLGDLLTISGDEDGAAESYETVEVVQSLGLQYGPVHARQMARFYSDHHLEPDLAVSLAEGELERRKDVYAWDAYAWALERAGRGDEASAAMQTALDIGIQDPVVLFHAGVIAYDNGDDSGAAELLSQSLAISPRFHPIHAGEARELLERLEG